MRAIIRADGMDSGAILLNGRHVHIKQPRDAVREGIGLIPEDRKNQGCFLSMDIEWNASIMNIKKLRKYLLLVPIKGSMGYSLLAQFSILH